MITLLFMYISMGGRGGIGAHPRTTPCVFSSPAQPSLRPRVHPRWQDAYETDNERAQALIQRSFIITWTTTHLQGRTPASMIAVLLLFGSNSAFSGGERTLSIGRLSE